MSGLLWSTLEVTTAFVVACIPATRLFVQHFFPVVKSSVSRALSSSGPNGGHAFSIDTLPSGNASRLPGRRAMSYGAPKYDEEAGSDAAAESHELLEGTPVAGAETRKVVPVATYPA